MIRISSIVIILIAIASTAFAQQSRFKKDTVYGYRASVGLKIAGTLSHLTYSGKSPNQPMPADYGSKVNVFPAFVLELVSRKPLAPVTYDFQLAFRNPGTFKASETTTSSGATTRYDYTVGAKYLRLEFGARYLFMRTSAIKPYIRPLIGVQYTASQSSKQVVTSGASSIEGSSIKLSKVGFAAGISAGISTKYVDIEAGFDVSRAPVKLPIGGPFSYDLGADFYKTIYLGIVAKPFL